MCLFQHGLTSWPPKWTKDFLGLFGGQLEKWVLASKPRKWAYCAKSYTKFNMRIMHKLGCYMVPQIPLSKIHLATISNLHINDVVTSLNKQKLEKRSGELIMECFPFSPWTRIPKSNFVMLASQGIHCHFLTIWVWLFSMLLDVLNNLILT